MRWNRRSGANPGMISPLGRGHRGGAHSISSGTALDGSWVRKVAAAAAAVGAEGRATAALGPAAADAHGVEVSAGGVELRPPATGRNEPHESSPLLGLKDSKFERERGVSETRKVKDEMKMKVKRGLYRGGG